MYFNCHSEFSFRYGVLSVNELIEVALKNQQKCIALTDINNTSACLNFVQQAIQNGIKPILGVDFRNGVQQQFVFLAKNNNGFEQINRYLSGFLHQKAKIPSRAEKLADTFVIYPFSRYRNEFIHLEENEFMGVSIDELQQLAHSPWRSHQHQFVLLQSVSFRSQRDFNVHRLLRAIDNNCLLSKLSVKEIANPKQQMCSAEQMDLLLNDYPQIKKNSCEILQEATIHFDFKEGKKAAAINHNRTHFGSGKKEDQRLLNTLCEAGLCYRFSDKQQREAVRPRMEKELQMVQKLGFETYFLICWDMLRFARSKRFFYVGRGSGANSLLAYLLQITDVDPVKLDLYFERFLNPYRESPPDFDMDFSWKDRNQVIDYLFEKYGEKDQIALLATYQTFSRRSLMRALGSVFGLPKADIDELAAERKPQTAPDQYVRLIYKYAAYMDGLPSHLSIHAGGIIISERPVYYYSATSMPPKGYPLLQFDMHHAEDVALYKFDVLSQRGLGKVKDAFQLVLKRNEGIDLDLHQMEKIVTDKKVNRLLKNGEALGCFYIESPAMRMLLTKLEVDNYLTLVAASSIIRPGVAQSGMMRTYILRARGEDKNWAQKTPQILQELMPETYGVMVYQEDVIKVAHYFADLSLGEADLMRRGMSGKFRSKESFSLLKQKFFDNCKAKGIEKNLVVEVWRQTESFAGYAFSKGHSASYAVESYQSLYLKAYYPMEFMLAVINNGGGYYSREIYLKEAEKLGAEIKMPCINKSDWLCSLYGKQDIYLGFSLLCDMEAAVAAEFIAERQKAGKFKSLEDFINRCSTSKEQLQILIRADAFRFTTKSKQQLLWELHHLLSSVSRNKAHSINMEFDLFSFSRKPFVLPQLDTVSDAEFYNQMELLGFSLISPFKLLKEQNLPAVKVTDLKRCVGKQLSIAGYLVAIKTSRTKNGKIMKFGTFMDAAGDWIDTVHFPQQVEQYPFKGRVCYLIEGKVMEEFGYLSIEVSRQRPINYRLVELVGSKNDE